MWRGIWRELQYLCRQKWDFSLVVVAPLLIIVLFSAMFMQGKPSHLPIAIIDQDQSQLSQDIIHHAELNHSLKIFHLGTQTSAVETLLNENKVWGYIHIPQGAEQRLVQGQSADISIAFNQSYFSIGNTISSAMLLSSLQGISAFSGEKYLGNRLPYLDAPTPNIKISTLYNPQLNYEFYLEPYMIPAILHLLLCCCVAFSVGQEFKRHTWQDWIKNQSLLTALVSKNLVYIVIFCLWTWLWMLWLVVFRGWFIAGSLTIIICGQILFYAAYAFLSSAVVLATQDLTKSFGFIAVYGGSSLSFAGVTLPLNNAPLFTQFWASIIPYTPYAKLQTEQWVIGSPALISFTPLLFLAIYALLYAAAAYFCCKKAIKGVSL